jgi:hypothetical protein
VGKAERKEEKERLTNEYRGRWIGGNYPSKHTREALLPGEEIVFGITYSGDSLVFPTNLSATNMRLLYTKQEKVGFGATVLEWQWRDLKNVHFKSGLILGNLIITPRYEGDNGLEMTNISKDSGKQIVKVCQEQIRHALDGTSATVSAVGGASRMQVSSAPQQQPAQVDPLAALKLRLANGEITVEQFKELSELLK